MELLWNSPKNTMHDVAGYEVYYILAGSNTTQSVGTIPQRLTNITLTSVLVLGNKYDFFVVAYSSNEKKVLPSAHSNTATIPLGKGFKT